MAAPYTGSWLRNAISEAEYTGAAKWGTGINAVHAIPGDILGEPPVRQPSKLNYDTPELGPGDDPDEYTLQTDEDQQTMHWSQIPQEEQLELLGYDYAHDMWGYGTETGLADRPSLGDSGYIMNQRFARVFPSWGGTRKPLPGGNFVRSLMHGALATTALRVLPNEDVAQGWRNKAHGIPGDSVDSDISTILVQTSEVQRYETREGSQSTGRASEYSAPIHSRVTGQKLKTYTPVGENRHWDMLPYEQEDFIRPFLSRQAGTGYPEWNYPQEMYQSTARQREPAPDPYPGEVTPIDDQTSGYSYEDVVY